MLEAVRDTKSKVILMADDDWEDYTLVRDAFLEHNQEIDLRWVKDGKEAMDYLEHRGKYKDVELSPRPDLILLDLYMPKKSGLDTLMDLKGHRDLRQIPVVILTSSGKKEHEERSYQLGASAFIIKPLTFSEMIDSMASLCAHWFGFVKMPEKDFHPDVHIYDAA